jgi:glycosyltransferase involved in cell wall biosynthesis
MSEARAQKAREDRTIVPQWDRLGEQTVKVTVVLACYNEEDHVVSEIERICRGLDASGYLYELLAIDDASTDSSLSLLKEVSSRNPTMRLLALRHNCGPGTARRIGTELARGEIVVWTDVDMTYPNERIPELVRLLDDDPLCDQVVGARTSEQGTHKILRILVKWFIRKLAEQLMRATIPDLNSGLRAFRRSVARPYLGLLPPGFSCVTTITLAFLSNHHHIRYVPIPYSKRSGISKFLLIRDSYRYLLQVLSIVMHFKPLRVLMPVCLGLVGLALIKCTYDLVANPAHLSIGTILIFLPGLIVGSIALRRELIVRSRNARRDARLAASGSPALPDARVVPGNDGFAVHAPVASGSGLPSAVGSSQVAAP